MMQLFLHYFFRKVITYMKMWGADCTKSQHFQNCNHYLLILYLHSVTFKHTMRLHSNEAVQNFPYKFLMQNSYISETLERNQINEHRHFLWLPTLQLKTNATWLCKSKSNKRKGRKQTKQESYIYRKEEEIGTYTTGS